MRPLVQIIRAAERGVRTEEGGYLAETMNELLPFLRMIARQDTASAQKCLDVMFEVLSIVHAGRGPKDREDCMEWARQQLCKSGIEVVPMGLSHAVIREENHG